MANEITFANADAVTGLTAVERQVTKVFAKYDLLSKLPVVRAANQTSAGAFTFEWNVEATNPTGQVRVLNSDFTEAQASVTTRSTSCAIIGSAFKADNVIGELSPEVIALNVEHAARGTAAKFTTLAINGDSNNAGEFDGLAAQLAGSGQEIDASAWDWSAVATVADAHAALEQLDSLLSTVVGDNQVILTNAKTKQKIAAICRIAGYQTASEDAAGRQVTRYAGIEIVDLGAAAGASTPVIPVTTGATDLYVASLDAVAGVHAVTPSNLGTVVVRLPKFDSGNSEVQRGSVQLVASVALRTVSAAAVAQGVIVSA